MGRTWMTGFAIVGVIGSGGAAIAGVVRTEVIGAAGDQGGISVTAPPATNPSPPMTVVTPGSPTVTTYDVGGAGWVDLAVGASTVTVEHAAAASGWSLLEITGGTTTVSVRFASPASVVVFDARLVAGTIETLVTQEPVLGPETTVAPADAPSSTPAAGPGPRPSTTPAGSAPTSPAPTSPAPATSATPSAPATTGATPATAAPAAPSTAPATTPPTTAHTTAPSGTSDDDDHDDEEEHGDDHDEEHGDGEYDDD